MANFPTIDALIAQMEGYDATQANGQPTLATRNNNPGNLIYDSYTAGLGGTPGAGGFAAFPTPQAGAAAEDSLVTSIANSGATLDQLVSQWSPANAPGNSAQSTAAYQNYLSSQLGVAGSTPVTQAEASGQVTPTASNSSLWQKLSNLFNNPLVTGPLGAGTGGFSGFLTDPARIAFFVLGLVLIIGGIYLFKPFQQGVTITTRAARRAGELLSV